MKEMFNEQCSMFNIQVKKNNCHPDPPETDRRREESKVVI